LLSAGPPSPGRKVEHRDSGSWHAKRSPPFHNSPEKRAALPLFYVEPQ
jgi:hypothetical protein